ncbi:MAG: hypothetical protein IPO64_17690 [Bacteroidetes bacterium]|nr:hypothetical protein [Bacteroidota bacterium]
MDYPKYMSMMENLPKGLELFIKVDWFVFVIFNAIWGGMDDDQKVHKDAE